MTASQAQVAWVPRKRRGAELTLLIFAIGIGVFAFVAVQLGRTGSVTNAHYGPIGVLVATALAAHLVIRRWAPYADPLLLPLVTCLNGLGLAMIYRIDRTIQASDDPRFPPFAGTQLQWTVLGVIGFSAVLIVLRDHRILQKYRYSFGLAAIVLLVLPLLPIIGTDVNGANIWIRIGPFSFQPGETAKVCLAIFFAGYLVQYRDALALAGRRVLGVDLPRARDLGPILIAWIVGLGILVLQNDLGSSLLFFGLFVVMLYVATERPGWLIVGSLLFVGGALLAYKFVPHVTVRFDAWLDPFADTDANGQLISGLFGLAHGGLLGRGLGQGSPTLTPFSFSDFILASFGEELGLTGLMAILLLYGLIVERGLRIAITCRDAFGKLLATGLAVSFALQVFVVAGGVTRLIPLTGLTAPFLAQGGSSIIMNWVIVALLLRISDQTRRPAPDTHPVGSSDETQVVRL